MAEETKHSHVAQYEPFAISGLKAGEVKYWCRCGLSKKQPWCDGSHKETGITPLPWTVPEEKTYYLCGCKHTNNSPLCDGTHQKLKPIVKERQEACSKSASHKQDCKLCTGCGWVPDF